MVTSMMRPLMKGPRSLMVTTSDLLLAMLITRTFVPMGRVLWAAVGALLQRRWPLAVFVP